jgi:hypothetical protein
LLMHYSQCMANSCDWDDLYPGDPDNSC